MEIHQYKQLLNGKRRSTHLTRDDYEAFRQEYVMGDALRGRTLGEAFCRHFGIVDYILSDKPGASMADLTIQETEAYIHRTYVGRTVMTYEYVSDSVLYG
jgi:hypothetical protein